MLPENFAFMGEEARKRELAERLDGAFPGPILGALTEAAAKHGVWIVGGGMPEKSDDLSRPYNTSVLIDPRGGIAATYRKVHLFDVSLPDGTNLRESAATSAGSEPVTADVLGVRLGMTVCYDVRFPELYRHLVHQGARVITIPAAFTMTTGKDHWHVLIRARAIENQVYVLAPGQHGKHPRGRQTYGKSIVVDPWGEVVAQCSEGEGTRPRGARLSPTRIACPDGPPGAASSQVVAGVPFLDLAAQEAECAPAALAAVARVAGEARFILGPHVETFEGWLAGATGVGHAVGVASGSDALELSLRAARGRARRSPW